MRQMTPEDMDAAGIPASCEDCPLYEECTLDVCPLAEEWISKNE